MSAPTPPSTVSADPTISATSTPAFNPTPSLHTPAFTILTSSSVSPPYVNSPHPTASTFPASVLSSSSSAPVPSFSPHPGLPALSSALPIQAAQLPPQSIPYSTLYPPLIPTRTDATYPTECIPRVAPYRSVAFTTSPPAAYTAAGPMQSLLASVSPPAASTRPSSGSSVAATPRVALSSADASRGPFLAVVLESYQYSCSDLWFATATEYCRMESDLPDLLRSNNHSPGPDADDAEMEERVQRVAGRLDDTIRKFMGEHILEMEMDRTQWHTIVELTPRLTLPRTIQGSSNNTWQPIQTGWYA